MKKLIQFVFLSMILSVFACGTDDDNTPNDPQIPENALYYFVGEVDGEPLEIFATLTGNTPIYNTHDGEIGTGQCIFGYGSFIGDISVSQEFPSIGFNLANFFNGSCSDEPDEFGTLFSTGELSFTEDQFNTVDKTAAFYLETTEHFYSSTYGNQTGSHFEITNITTENNAFGLYQAIEGTVNCTLYNEDDPSDFMTIENGVFKLQVGSYFN